jgi:hypothetical protein
MAAINLLYLLHVGLCGVRSFARSPASTHAMLCHATTVVSLAELDCWFGLPSCALLG